MIPFGVATPTVRAFASLRSDERAGQTGVVEIDGPVSERQIIALARESQAEAFEVLYSTYKGRLYTFVLRMTSDPELADDITHDVYAKVYRLLPTLAAESRVLPWLYRIANNAAIDQIRRRRRFTWLRIGALTGTPEEPRADGHDGKVSEQHHVQAVLRTLPPENAAALLLHAVEGYSYKEIASIQSVSLTAVRSRIARARAAFKERYQE